ncbi:hypothetical protein MPTK2_3g14480 [Marchantia polymorpha subsp. ruderalis]
MSWRNSSSGRTPEEEEADYDPDLDLESDTDYDSDERENSPPRRRRRHEDEAQPMREDPPRIQEDRDAEPPLDVKRLEADAEIDNHYKKVKVLGAGAYAVTHEVLDAKNPGVRYAMKIQEKPERDSASAESDGKQNHLRMYKEVVILNIVLPRHKNIICLKDLLLSKNNVYIVQELCQELNLEDFYPVADNSSGRMIFKQLVEAVHFMHQFGVVHADLKAENILFSKPDFSECKIIDFGLAVYKPEWATRRRNNFDVSEWFSEEELVTDDDLYEQATPATDIESLGRILFSIMAGTEVPVLSEELMNLDDNPYEPRYEIFDESAADLLENVMCPMVFRPDEAVEAPDLGQVLQHPWLAGEEIPAPPEEFLALSQESVQSSMDFAILQSNLTALADLFKDWLKSPATVMRDIDDLTMYYEATRSMLRGTKVMECVDVRDESRVYALKVLARVGEDANMTEEEVMNQPFRIYNELLIRLRILPRHDHLVSIVDVLVQKDFVVVVSELCEGPTLEEFFPLARNGTARHIFKQLAETVRFMHEFGVVHMDLHCHHIVVTDEHFTHCKIVQFSKALYDSELATRGYMFFDREAGRWINGDLEFMALDANVEVDIRALGRILHSMMAGIHTEDTSNLPPPRLDLFDPHAADLLSKIGPSPFGPDENQWNHMTLLQICQHPWLLLT